MIAHELGIAPDRLEPAGEALVQLGACLLGDGLVGGLADEQVAKAKGILAGRLAPLGPDELLADEPREDVIEDQVRPRGREVAHRAEVEHPTLDRRPFEDDSLVVGEPVDARRQQQVDRRRDANVRHVADHAPSCALAAQDALVDEHRDHLLHEQRIALRGLVDALADVIGQRDGSEQRADEALGVGPGQRLHEDRRRVELACAPVWAGPARARRTSSSGPCASCWRRSPAVGR